MSETSAGQSKTWMERMGISLEDLEPSTSPASATEGRVVSSASAESLAPAGPSPSAAPADGPSASQIAAAYNGYLVEQQDAVEQGIGRLREEAQRIAHIDAEAGVPLADVEGRSESESELAQRCRAFFERWQSSERRRLNDVVAGAEEQISEKLGLASIAIDRFERLTNDLIRLRARVTTRRLEVAKEIDKSQETAKERGLPTRVYLGALGFLGLVEFFANGPVFGALLPRDPLTERQIRLIAETSSGMFAGVQRVFGALILRPDASLLAAGVVTFLCVLAHFFGHSLRDLVIKKDQEAKRHAVSSRSIAENVVPMILSGVGLVLVIFVLFTARVRLGEVGETDYRQDITAVEELRRNAGWLRVDGDLLAANEQANRADDLEAAATRLREYAASMSGLSWPILLLNTTLVLCAISAAYFHRRDDRREFFNESPFEEERKDLIREAEQTAMEVTTLLAELVRRNRVLKSIMASRPLDDWRSIAHQLQAVLGLYRAENGRARGLDPRTIPAFRQPIALDLDTDPNQARELVTRDPLEYEKERQALKSRFEGIRKRFVQEGIAG
ncbi:MAG: hypothetical protein KAJ67_08840 [Gemmatimonadetes bacterium]|nr:hypothetical protein [Gemmatimonadota bacterium]